LTKQIAELFEQDGNKEEAITNFDQAADYYSGEVWTNKCRTVLKDINFCLALRIPLKLPISAS
jgi:hypothetical protein